ncbi:mitogen-activated protein kinase 7-like [Macrosteles quadrilineatus]|uniref:mitogen-activated protein kinase 7-like n=1 Tax=Macrosteles quadrilineatus TaxID=74068 RepID=UPI0023E17AF6|nr:mitogen-activated protein kinase 7-like [Macrosteles quadrilineatus]XP_054270651.1 mitogen-activated protein kinase 7-like [Macrosteles quadrilineatus]
MILDFVRDHPILCLLAAGCTASLGYFWMTRERPPAPAPTPPPTPSPSVSSSSSDSQIFYSANEELDDVLPEVQVQGPSGDH